MLQGKILCLKEWWATNLTSPQDEFSPQQKDLTSPQDEFSPQQKEDQWIFAMAKLHIPTMTMKVEDLELSRNSP